MSGFEIVSLLLALPATFEQIIKYGNDLRVRVRAVRDPGSILRDSDLDIFEREPAILEQRLVIGQQICNLPSIDERVKDILDTNFRDLQACVHDAFDYVSEVERWKGSVRFWKAKKPMASLKERVVELDRLVRNFMDIVQLAKIQDALPPRVFLDPTVWRKISAAPIIDVCKGDADDDEAVVQLVQGFLAKETLRTAAKQGSFLCERREYSTQTKSIIGSDVRSLTELLASHTTTGGLLNVVGYVDDAANEFFEVVFDVPNSYSFQGSLRKIISSRTVLSLNARLALCIQLADAVIQVTTLKLVHKKINSANIVFWKDGSSAPAKQDDMILSLVNWTMVRKAGGATNMEGNSVWSGRLYQHPTRQVLLAEKEYTMAHDIYSLGVCMLELLIWNTLVQEDENGQEHLSATFTQVANDLFSTGDIKSAGTSTSDQVRLPDPRDVQKILVTLATNTLPVHAGDQIANLVVSCLNVLEDGSALSGVAVQDRLESGLKYTSAVQNVLRDIRI